MIVYPCTKSLFSLRLHLAPSRRSAIPFSLEYACPTGRIVTCGSFPICTAIAQRSMKFCRVLLETSQRQGADFRRLHVFYKLTKKGIKNLPDKSADACEAEAHFAQQFLQQVNTLYSLRSGEFLVLKYSVMHRLLACRCVLCAVPV